MRTAKLLAVMLTAGVAGLGGCARFGSSLNASTEKPQGGASLSSFLTGVSGSEASATDSAALEGTREAARARSSWSLFDMFSPAPSEPGSPSSASSPAEPAPPPLIAQAPSGIQVATAAVPTQEELLAKLKARADVEPTEYARWEKIVQETPEADWPLVALQLQAVMNYKDFQVSQGARVRSSESAVTVSETSSATHPAPKVEPPAAPPPSNPQPEPAKAEPLQQASEKAETPKPEPAKPESAKPEQTKEVASSEPAAAASDKPDVLPPPAEAKPPQPIAAARASEQEPAEAAPKPGAWRAHLDQAIVALEAELRLSIPDAPAAVGASPSPMTDEPFRTPTAQQRERAQREAHLRLLYLAGARHEDAVRGVEQFPPAEQEFWKHQLHGLSVFLHEEGAPVPDRRARLTLRELREGLHHLAAASGLDVRNLAFCPQVFGFGNYVEFAPYEFRANQEVLLYAEIDNFTSEARPDGFETELQGSYQIFDAAGRRVAEHVFPPEKEVCRNRRRDYFVPFRMYLPKRIEPGPYTLQLTVEDLKGHKFGQAPIRFTIVP